MRLPLDRSAPLGRASVEKLDYTGNLLGTLRRATAGMMWRAVELEQRGLVDLVVVAALAVTVLAQQLERRAYARARGAR
jgi:hypothetical protein